MSLPTEASNDVSDPFFAAPLSEADPAVSGMIGRELGRQRDQIELIASENIVSRAVLEALFGVQSGFVRTPKYAIEGNGQKRMAVKKYKSRSGWLPYFELAVGSYFLYMCWFAIETNNFLTLPFLTLFVGGYYWAGFGTLYQEYQDRLRHQRQHKLAFETSR